MEHLQEPCSGSAGQPAWSPSDAAAELCYPHPSLAPRNPPLHPSAHIGPRHIFHTQNSGLCHRCSREALASLLLSSLAHVEGVTTAGIHFMIRLSIKCSTIQNGIVGIKLASAGSRACLTCEHMNSNAKGGAQWSVTHLHAKPFGDLPSLICLSCFEGVTR